MKQNRKTKSGLSAIFLTSNKKAVMTMEQITNKPINSTRPALIQGAMDSEICVLINQLEHVRKEEKCGFPFYIGSLNGHPVIVQKTFMGMTNAAAATILAIEHYSPAFVINQGICGGHSPKLHRGDVLLGRDIINYANYKIGETDSDNPLDGCEAIGLEPIFPMNEKKIKLFHSDEKLLSIAQKCIPPEGCKKIMCGTIASADAWTDRKDLIKLMHETFHTCGEDMETASAAQLCHSFGIPFLSIRMLSNSLVQDEDYDETVADHLQEYSRRVLTDILTNH